MRHVIVGGGVAGMTAAMDLARRGEAEVLVFSDEAHPYYYRPQLTEFLVGQTPMERLVRRPLEWYAERGMTVRLETPATGLDVEARQVTLADGESVPYDRLLLATGSLPFVPPIKGADKEGVRTWRTLTDTLTLELVAASCQQVVVLGGGLLGLEAARGLRGFCHEVTVLEALPRLMPRQLDVEGAALLQAFVASLGIQVVVGARCEAFEGSARVSGVRLTDGTLYPAQTVVVAAGVRANATLAEAAGIAVDRGIIVDDRMATSAPNVYAAGDVAVFRGYSWAIAPIAQAQGRVAAANMAGDESHYDVVIPSTTLKVVGIDVSSVGFVNPEGEEAEEIRALDVDAGTYKKIVLRDGVIVGSIVINDRILAKALEARIAAQEPMTPDEAREIVG
jgi:NAD(P)H-nitrite reductase large subunit